ncbi:MAG: glycosyltransferase family 1 protein [Chloroflexota bacterium]|nr:MAG: glycosyltransferase family 1 protein [Chloroflexota bacterium]
MRVAIDYNPALKQGGGIGRYTRGLVQELVALATSDQFVLYYNYEKGDRPPTLFPRAKHVIERPLALPDRWLTILWHRLHIPLPIDLVTGPVDLFHFPDFVVPPTRRGKKVVTVHDLSFLVYPETADEGLRLYLERAVPLAIRDADFVLVDSANTQNDLICLLDADPDRVAVVYPGIDSQFQIVDDPSVLGEIRHRYNLQFPFILHLSVIEPRKNLSRLISAYARLRRDGVIPHRLVIGGGLGWMYQSVFETVEELDMSDDVVFLGRIPDVDLPALYSLADLFVYPSLYEGFGIPPLEAMACGTPVVTSNTSSLPEAVGNAGITVDPLDIDAIADAMARILTDPTLADDLSGRGLAQATKFTWRSSAEKVLGIYRRLVDGPR